jgi:hypothetical protein
LYHFLLKVLANLVSKVQCKNKLINTKFQLYNIYIVLLVSWKHIVACGLCSLIIAYCLVLLEYTYFDCVIFEAKIKSTHPLTHSLYPPTPNSSTHDITALATCLTSSHVYYNELSSGRIPTVENWFLISDFQWPKFSIEALWRCHLALVSNSMSYHTFLSIPYLLFSSTLFGPVSFLFPSLLIGLIFGLLFVSLYLYNTRMYILSSRKEW